MNFLLCKAPTFKLAVISLEIRFSFSCIFFRFFLFFLSSLLIYYSKKNSLINVQLICMMARNNIFYGLIFRPRGKQWKRFRGEWVVGWLVALNFFVFVENFSSWKTFFYHQLWCTLNYTLADKIYSRQTSPYPDILNLITFLFFIGCALSTSASFTSLMWKLKKKNFFNLPSYFQIIFPLTQIFSLL